MPARAPMAPRRCWAARPSPPVSPNPEVSTIAARAPAAAASDMAASTDAAGTEINARSTGPSSTGEVCSPSAVPAVGLMARMSSNVELMALRSSRFPSLDGSRVEAPKTATDRGRNSGRRSGTSARPQ